MRCPLLSSLFVDLSQFCTGIDNQSISSNMEKHLHKVNDVIILRKLAKRQ